MSAVKVRPMTRRELAEFRLARLVAGERMPYFMRALYAAQPLAAEGLGTFAVDRHWRLYVDPTLLIGADAWPKHEAAAVLLHEVGHLIRDHAGRADQLPRPLLPVVWNYAADAEINDDLLAAGAPLPIGVVTPEGLGLLPNDLAESYYVALIALAPTFPEDTGCGSGSGSGPVAGELGDADLSGAAPGLVEAEGQMVRRLVARDVQDHIAAKGRGTVAAGLERWAEAELAAPTVPWTRLLRALVRRVVARFAGRTDYTYSRPSRRRVPGVVLPAMRAPRVGVAVVVDTSGSMSEVDLSAAMSEISGVLASSGIDRENVRVLSCDARAASASQVRSVRDIHLVGGGGT